MAVVQISKLQVRRGIKSQTGLPQLAAGEFGWAVDTQQLYIGNGSVSEGAPFVGNTEILTAKSNIFSLLPNYSYKGYSSSSSASSGPYSIVNLLTGPNNQQGITTRTLQSKLDDLANIRDFGALGNGTADDTAAIQLAIDELYLNTDKTNPLSRRVLYMPAGNYLISNTIFIPSNVTLVGEGRNNTVITMTQNNVVLIQTKASDSIAGQTPNTLSSMTSTTAPVNVRMVGISFKRMAGLLRNTPIFLMDALSYGVFDDCQFSSTWVNGTGVETSYTVGSDSAITIRGNGTVTSNKVVFNNCHFHNVTHAVYSDYNSQDISWTDCYFTTCYRAFTLAYASTGLAAQSTGPQYYSISNSVFDAIDGEAIRVYPTNSGLSKGHKSNNNRFYDVGNGRAGIGGSYLPAIVYGGTQCESTNDFFQRSRDINSNFQVAYVPDVVGAVEVKYGVKQGTLVSNIQPSNAAILLETPMAGTSSIIIDYTISKPSKNLYRNGTLTIVVNKNMSSQTSVTNPVMSEKFNSTTGDDGNIRFYVQAVTLPINNAATSRVTGPTLILQYSNSDGPGNDATINYSTKIISDLDSTYV